MRPMPHKRILIIGDGGSGKSTLADRLAGALNIQVTHLDRLRGDDTFEFVGEDIYRQRHDRVLVNDRWIIEGIPRGPLISPTAVRRLRDCDTVIFLDTSPLVSLLRSWRRSREYADLAKGVHAAIPHKARYRFNTFNIKRTIDFHFRIRPGILSRLKAAEIEGKSVFIVRDGRELESVFARMTKGIAGEPRA